MAAPTKIRVMTSSRCDDPVDLGGQPTTLSALRLRLKQELEQVQLLGSTLFDVWINEDAPPTAGSTDAWEHCLSQVAIADIVIVIYNGRSGWAKHEGEVGICHAELHKALSIAPAKVRLIELPILPEPTGSDGERDQRFQTYVRTQSRFRGAKALNGDEVILRCKEALRDAAVDMVRLGGREAKRGKFHMGDALDWSRLDFEHRRQVMVDTLRHALAERNGSDQCGLDVCIQVAGHSVLTVCHAIPASMTTPGALDLVHQPFVRDHGLAARLTNRIAGPIHFIVCHRAATEAQALKQLGLADAIVVSPPFGVYVADSVQKVQLLFIGNCRDATSTRHGVQRAFEWLEQSGEDLLLAQRTAARSRIIKAIAQEM